MACERQLRSVVEVLVGDGASILIQEPSDPEIWVLPTFGYIQMGINSATNEIVVIVHFMPKNYIHSSITHPKEVNLFTKNESKDSKPFHKIETDNMRTFLPHILEFPSPHLVPLLLGTQLHKYDNLLFLAVEHGHPVVLRELLKDLTPSQTHIENTINHQNLLHKAIALKNNGNLEILMKHCTSSALTTMLSSKNESGFTPLKLAINSHQLSAIAIIFENGGNELLFEQWFINVNSAIINCNIEVLKVLMNYFTKEHEGKLFHQQTNDEGLSILHIAVKNYHSEEIFDFILGKYKNENLIDLKVTLPSSDFENLTPLLLSLKNKQYLATEKLLEAGAANLNEGEQCYFHYLIKFCQEEEELKELEKLLNIDLDPNQFSQCSKPSKAKIWEVTDNDSNTLLHYSVKCYNSIVLDLLGEITPFTDLLRPDSKGNSLLHTAATLPQHSTVIDCIIDIILKFRRNAQYSELLDLQNKNDGCTALMLAVQLDHLKFIESLIYFKEGASILPVNHEGDSILHIAAKLGREDIFKLILDFIDECKIDRTNHLKMLHQPNKEGYSPIQCAVIYAKIEIVKLFSKKHSLYFFDHKTGYSLLHLVVDIKWIDLPVQSNLITELLTDKDLLEIKDKYGRTPLMLSTIMHRVDIVSILLQHQPDLLTIDSLGLSLLHYAVISYDENTFSIVLNAIRSDKNSGQILNFEEMEQKKTALYYSIEKNNKEATEEILKLGLSLESEDIEGNTYLHVASKSPSAVDILKLILRHAKSSSKNISTLLKKQNKENLTPLLYAIFYQNYEACKSLVDENANLFYQTVNGPAFHKAINKSPLIVCQHQSDYCIGYSFSYNGNTCCVLSPLTDLENTKPDFNSTIKVFEELNNDLVNNIIRCEQAQPLQALLQQIDFVKCSQHRKKSSLYILAAQFGSLPIVLFLIKEYFKSTDFEFDHGSILHAALSNPNINIIKELCNHVQQLDCHEKVGEILSTKQENGVYPLELCIREGKVETFEYLLKSKFQLEINFRDSKGNTLFHFILENVRASKTRKQFLDKLATAIQDRENKKPKSTYINNTPLVDCQIQDSGETPLHLCASKYPDCISTILQLNPSPIKEDSSGNTALHLSVKSDNFNSTKEIVNAYKNSGITEIINKPNKKKQTPLHIAVEIANLEIVELLLCNDSKLYAVDEKSRTVLHYAVLISDSSESEKVVKFLLEHETNIAEPNQSISTYQDHKGYTPLHSAIACSNLESMNVLLQSSSDFNKRDLEGNSILHLALMHYKKSVTILHNILETFQKESISLSASNENELINLKNNQGQTALILAFEKENVDALNEILRYFPLLHLTDNDGNSCLHKAVESVKDLTCLDKLLEIIKERYPKEMKSYLNEINASGLSPLHHAIMNKNHRIAEKLCNHGANIAIQLPNGDLALCNGKGIEFKIAIGPPSSTLRTIGNLIWKDMKDYFVCYDIVDKADTYHIVSQLPGLESTTITTTNNLKTLTESATRALQMICSSHCTEPLIYAIKVKWIDFTKKETENDTLWEVLCGDISDEVTDYLFTKYPDIMNSSKMFKLLENATKNQQKDRVIAFLKRNPNFGKQDICPNEEMNTRIQIMILTIKNSLEYSIDNKNTDILNILLQHGASFYHLYENDDTLLHMIIQKKRPVTFLTSILEKIRELQSNNSEQLIEGNSMINHQNNEGKPALHICIENGHDELLEKLLEYQPELTLSDASKNNILHCVAKLGSELIAKIIFEHLKSPFPNSFPETFFEKNQDGCTPLHLAAEFGNESIFSTLLEKGADLYATDTLKQTTLHYSLKNVNKDNRLAIVKLILHQHSNIKVNFIKCQDAKGLSALHTAVKLQYTAEVGLILRADPTVVDLEDNELQTPLHLAVIPTSSDLTVVTPPSNEIFDQIINSIVKPEVCTLDTHQSNGRLICHQDINGKTALHISIASKYDYAIEKLLKAHACLDLTDYNEDTILHEAVKHPESPTVVECILQQIKQRNLNTQDFLSETNRQGLRPLHLAIIHKNLPSIILLSPDTTLSFKHSSGKITLCDNISGLILRFLEDRVHQKYYTGYSFQLSKNTSTYWVYTDLPNFNESVFDGSCNFIPLRNFDNVQVSFLEVLVKCKSHEPLSSLIRQKGIALTDKIGDGLKFIQFSAKFASPQVMEYILEMYNRTVFEPIDKGPSLIECAVLNSNTDTLQLLLAALTNFQEKDENQQVAISKCLMSSIKKSINKEKSIALEFLLRHKGCLSYLYGNYKRTLLHYVTLRMKGKDSHYAELILNVAKDLQIKIKSKFGEFSFINFPDLAGKTALHLAISKGRFDIMKVLLKFNPDLSIQNELVDTVLHHSVRNKGINFVKVLLEVINACPEPEKYLEARNTEGLTPVQLAVSHSNAAITKNLLDSNVKFYVRDEKTNETLLHRTMQMTDNPSIRKMIIETLLKHEKEFLKLDKHEITLLKDHNNNTPLHQAVLKQQSDTFDILLSADPSVVLIPGDNNRTPLHMAVLSQNQKNFDTIIEYIKQEFETSDDPSIDKIICKQDIDDKTPVHLSIDSRNFYALEKLLSLSKYCLETTDKFQDTLLHYAVKVSGEKCEYLKKVLEAFKTHFPEDFQSHLYPWNSDGFPPLQYAIELNKLPAALILIESSVQLPYQDRENNYLLCSPNSQLPLRILYKTSSKYPPSEYWIGFRVEVSSKISWFATNLPVISQEKSGTSHFNSESSMAEIEPNKFNTNILKAILRSHSTDPFKSAVSSNLITQNLKVKDGYTILKYVGQYSTREVIAFYIDLYKCVIFESTKEQSLIEYTVANSDLSVLRFLLEKLPQNSNQSLTPPRSDAAQEVIDQFKIALCLKSALRLSLNNNNIKALDLLLEFNARYDHTYDGENTLLHLMVIQHKPCEFIKSFLTRISEIEKLPADSGTIRFIDAQNAQKETALHLALQTKQENTINAILSFDPNLLIQNSNGNTPLHSSILLKDFEIVESILNLGIKQNPEIVNTANKQKCTPLHLSVDNGDFNITKLLLNSNADIYCQDLLNRTVLHHAIANIEKNLVLVKELINFKNKTFSPELCSMKDSDGNTPLNLAIKISNYEIVKILLEFPSVIKVANNLKQTPLHLAVLSLNKKIFQSILDAVLKIENLPTRESIINSQDSEGHTPLHLCIISDNPNALVKILANNPYLETIDGDGNSILHDAVIKPEILKILIPKLSDSSFTHFYSRNKTGLPPLQIAIKHKMFESVDELTKVGIKLAFSTDNGETLCDMIEGFSLEIVEYKYGHLKYWVGYTYEYTKSDVWVLSELPKLETTIQVYKSKPNIVKKLNKDLLGRIAECSSPEPLDAAFRNEKLKFDTKLEDGFEITEIIAQKGTLRSIKYILEKNHSTLIEGKDNHLSMVESAVRNPNIDVLEFLLKSIDTYQPNSNSKSHPPNDYAGIAGIALSEESTQICSCLKNSLLLSISNESSKALISLLYFYPKIDCTYTDDNTLIHQMIMDNKSSNFIKEVLEVIREIETSNPLYKDKQIINHCNFKKKTALHCCIERKQLSTLEVLLQFDPEALVIDENEETPLHYAVNRDKLEFVKAIYQHAPCIELLSAKNNIGDTALHLAVKNANNGIVEFILKCEPPFDSQNCHGSTVLHLAVVIGKLTQRKLIMKQLIFHNASKGLNVTRIQDRKLKSPLHLAVSKQYPDAVDSLLSADPTALHIRDNKGQTPLHLTIIPSLPCPTTISGIPLESQLNNDIFDSVLVAIEQQGKHGYKAYCEGKHLLCFQDKRKRTAMHYAIEHNYQYAFREILKTGSCLNIPDEIGNILTHEAGRSYADVFFIESLTEELGTRYPDILDCFKIEKYGK